MASLQQEISIRLKDPRIFLNEFFGYSSFITGLITVFFLTNNNQASYQIFNQILLASCALQNLPLLMVYIPQWRVLLSTGILGIIVTNYFATHPIGNAFREGLFVGMIKVDYSYEALVKIYPEKYLPESKLLGKSSFKKNISAYLILITQEIFIRSREMLNEIKAGHWKVFIHDPIRSQFFSSLLRIFSALPLFIIAFFEILIYFGLFKKTLPYSIVAGLLTTISIRALAFSSFLDGLSKIAFGFMRECFMMRVGGMIFAAAQFYLMINGESSLQLVIPLSLSGLAAYPIAEGERLRKLALNKSII